MGEQVFKADTKSIITCICVLPSLALKSAYKPWPNAAPWSGPRTHFHIFSSFSRLGGNHYPRRQLSWDAPTALRRTHIPIKTGVVWSDAWFAAHVAKVYLVRIAANFFPFLGMRSDRAQKVSRGKDKTRSSTNGAPVVFIYISIDPIVQFRTANKQFLF